MPAPNVDLALVIDTSDSMKNCFDQLRQNLDALLKPMQGAASHIHYALVGASASFKSIWTATYCCLVEVA